MARNGSGTYDLPGADFTNGTLADADEVMAKLDDIASALTASIAKDGQTTPTENLPMGGFNHTGVGVATARAHYARASQVADSTLTYGGVAGGTADAITLAPSPAITAYAIGQKFQFKTGSGANTTAVTANVNGVGAGAVTWPDGTALVAGDLPANALVEVSVQATTPVFHLQTQTRAPAALFNINGLTTETAPAVGDLFPLYDLSATANRKMTLADILSIIASLTAKTTPVPADFLPISDSAASNAAKTSTIAQVLAAVTGLTADTAPDSAADYVLTYDASASAAKKVLVQYLGRPVSSQAASSSAQLDFTIDANFDYEFWLDRVCPASDGVNLTMLFSVDNGSNYLTTGTYSSISSQETTALNGTTSGSATSILLAGPIKNSAGFGASGVLRLVVGGAAIYGTNVEGQLRYIESTGSTHVKAGVAGSNSTTSQVTNVRFIMSSGNIATGTIRQRALPK